jgi:hypothetical protein
MSTRSAAECGAVLDALDEVSLLGFISPGHQQRVRELWARATALGAPADPNAIGAAFDEFAHLVAEAERALVEELHEYGSASFSAFDSLWASGMDVRLAPAVGTCPYCGRLLSVMRGTHYLHPHVSREVQLCHRCGPVLDLPVGSQLAAVQLRFRPVWHRPGDETVEVLVEPRAGGAVRTGLLSVHLSGGALIGVKNPAPIRIAVGTGPSVWRCQLRLTDVAPAHQQWVRALALVDGQIHYASRPVSIRPAALDTPGQQRSDDARTTRV